jgi:hypothetical protein
VQPDVALWRQVTVGSYRPACLRNGSCIQPCVAWQHPSIKYRLASFPRALCAAAQKQHARDLHTYYWKRMRDIMSERHQLSLAMAVRTSGFLLSRQPAHSCKAAGALLCFGAGSHTEYVVQATCELPPDIVQSPSAAQCKLWHQNQDIACKHSEVC